MPIGHEHVVSYLQTARVIAVVGVKPNAEETSAQIFGKLVSYGYVVYGVNPKAAGTFFEGRPIFARLGDVPEPIDIVDFFRDARHLPGHLDEVVNLDPLPSVVWLQQGIQNDEFAAQLGKHGIKVVQDYCIAVAYATHRALIEAPK